MRRRLALAFLLLLAVCVSAADDPLNMELSARAGDRQQTASGRPAAMAESARPSLIAHSGSSLHIRWSIVNQQKSGSVPDVTVHLVLGKASGEAEYESAIVMDFPAQAKSSADITAQLPPPGTYVLRLETIGAAKTHGHEHVARMDVKVLP